MQEAYSALVRSQQWDDEAAQPAARCMTFREQWKASLRHVIEIIPTRQKMAAAASSSLRVLSFA
eukprot:scaffold16329_cov83-Cylindrotheca_fusiformis.AAC.1